MGKTFKKYGNERKHSEYAFSENACNYKEETVWVSLDEIHIADEKIDSLLKRDSAQIQAMRNRYEEDRPMIRVVLAPHPAGGYTVKDGRHRCIAAKLANVAFVEAVILG